MSDISDDEVERLRAKLAAITADDGPLRGLELAENQGDVLREVKDIRRIINGRDNG